MSCYVMLYHVMSCYVMMCYVMLCYIVFYYVMLCHATVCNVIFYVMSRNNMRGGVTVVFELALLITEDLSIRV